MIFYLVFSCTACFFASMFAMYLLYLDVFIDEDEPDLEDFDFLDTETLSSSVSFSISFLNNWNAEVLVGLCK